MCSKRLYLKKVIASCFIEYFVYCGDLITVSVQKIELSGGRNCLRILPLQLTGGTICGCSLKNSTIPSGFLSYVRKGGTGMAEVDATADCFGAGVCARTEAPGLPVQGTSSA